MDGSLDFNFPISNNSYGSNTTNSNAPENTVASSQSQSQTTPTHSQVQYSARTSVTPPSWVH